ncbi:hypothetical protein IHE44_0003162 [Lamprotornis superbus]|uniref:non-specific serine/threonine protein kinase n=1 Tax=Lamprotornis superbus TaxID=245042 RepID=A0A835NE62_9PASS|nr:hypothetical protein IHE44_0003162 [Lamprotornis superbus]
MGSWARKVLGFFLGTVSAHQDNHMTDGTVDLQKETHRAQLETTQGQRAKLETCLLSNQRRQDKKIPPVFPFQELSRCSARSGARRTHPLIVGQQCRWNVLQPKLPAAATQHSSFSPSSSPSMAQELFLQVLEAVWHCISCEDLHRDIKPENTLFVLASSQAKLINFGCGTYLQDTAYTRFAGEPMQGYALSASISWPSISGSNLGVDHHHTGPWNGLTVAGTNGKAATIWSLGILLHQIVCGEHPLRRGRNISWSDQLSLSQWLSQECQDLIRWCLSMHDLDRSSLEDLFCDPWMQDIHLP